MNRFASQLDLTLLTTPADLLLLATPACVSGLVLAAVVIAQPGPGISASMAGLFLLWVAVVMVHACRAADAGWMRLIAHADGTFELADARKRVVAATVIGNFRCPWVVLITIKHSAGRYRQWVWRHRQPDDFRHLLVALTRAAGSI